jgi:hypothetical protein
MFPFPFSFTVGVPDIPVDRIANAQAMSFNGTDQYISAGTSSDLNFERTDTFSISAWINIETLQIGGIFAKDVFSPLQGYNLFLNNSIRFYIAGTGYIQINGSQTLSTSQWYHIAVTYDGSSNVSGIKLYVNGVEDTSTTSSGTTVTGSIQNVEPPRIGVRDKNGSSPDPRYFFNGNIDEVAVFNTALSASKIQQIYNATAVVGGVPQTANLFTGGLDTSLVYWNRMGDS